MTQRRPTPASQVLHQSAAGKQALSVIRRIPIAAQPGSCRQGSLDLGAALADLSAQPLGNPEHTHRNRADQTGGR